MGANRILAAAVLVPWMAACSDGMTTPTVDRTDVVLALVGLAMTGGSVAGGSETSAHACPSGGRFVVEGAASYEADGEGTMARWDRTVRFEACASAYEGSIAVSDGSMRLAGEARFGAPVEGRAPLLSQSSSQVGTMRTTFEGETTTCAYDLTHTFDPGARRYRLRGTVCGRAVDTTVPAAP